jgi:hypothetical protein
MPWRVFVKNKEIKGGKGGGGREGGKKILENQKKGRSEWSNIK